MKQSQRRAEFRLGPKSTDLSPLDGRYDPGAHDEAFLNEFFNMQRRGFRSLVGELPKIADIKALY